MYVDPLPLHEEHVVLLCCASNILVAAPFIDLSVSSQHPDSSHLLAIATSKPHKQIPKIMNKTMAHHCFTMCYVESNNTQMILLLHN